MDTVKICMTDGGPVEPGHKEIDPATGMQKGYIVLCPEERAKGFVRPVRQSYKHVGQRPQYPIRALTDDERERYSKYSYVCFEAYPESESPATGRYWTEEQLKSGCGTTTTMSLSLAETYARQPSFYSHTFCVGCHTHFLVAEFVWEGTNDIVGA